MKSTMEKNLTTGSIFKNVLVFSLPYLLSYFNFDVICLLLSATSTR